MWSEYIKQLYQFTELNIKNVLDLSCGTGKHIDRLQGENIFFIGADYSGEMVKAAAINLKKSINHPCLLVNDARHVAIKNASLDVVLMLYDSINYLLDTRDVEKLFFEIGRILKPGGIFIFDFVTEAGLQECFDGYYESENWDGLAYERESRYSKKEKLQYNTFKFLFNGRPGMEEHIQKVRTAEEWKKFVQKSKMHLTAEFSNFSLSLPNPKSERIHFVCKKEKA